MTNIKNKNFPIAKLTSIRRFCSAPMMNCTDRHQRYLIRLISQHIYLYTQMITSQTLLHGGDRYLDYNTLEHPLAIQFGGSNPEALSRCAIKAEQAGYDEINLNIGCPSDRVQQAKIGACLMAEPKRVQQCVAAMVKQVNIPVTVKTRIGIDNQDSFEALVNFIAIVQQGGCEHFIIHARKAWLQGLSPKQNRTLPNLDYQRVYQLKQHFPELEVIINGGIKTIAETQQHLSYVDGVMIGRELYHHPYLAAEVNQQLFQQRTTKTREQVFLAYCEYAESQLQQGVTLWQVMRHAIGLYHGQYGAKKWRNYMTRYCQKYNHLEQLKMPLEIMHE